LYFWDYIPKFRESKCFFKYQGTEALCPGDRALLCNTSYYTLQLKVFLPGHREGVIEAMKSYPNDKTFAIPR
jgi:hypothetical protein